MEKYQEGGQGSIVSTCDNTDFCKYLSIMCSLLKKLTFLFLSPKNKKKSYVTQGMSEIW